MALRVLRLGMDSVLQTSAYVRVHYEFYLADIFVCADVGRAPLLPFTRVTDLLRVVVSRGLHGTNVGSQQETHNQMCAGIVSRGIIGCRSSTRVLRLYIPGQTERDQAPSRAFKNQEKVSGRDG